MGNLLWVRQGNNVVWCPLNKCAKKLPMGVVQRCGSWSWLIAQRCGNCHTCHFHYLLCKPKGQGGKESEKNNLYDKYHYKYFNACMTWKILCFCFFLLKKKTRFTTQLPFTNTPSMCWTTKCEICTFWFSNGQSLMKLIMGLLFTSLFNYVIKGLILFYENKTYFIINNLFFRKTSAIW